MFFGPPTAKWRPCKIFAKLIGNYLLIANIFEFHEDKDIWFNENAQYVQNLICQ